MIKTIIKKTIPGLPGYHNLCLFLRRHKRPNMEWMDRIPIAPGTQVLVHSLAGDLYMSRPERCSIAKKYFWTQGVREPVEDLVALNLFAILAKRSEVALDIGANSGLFSLVAAKANPQLSVVAFDILPEAYHILLDNLMLNHLLERVETRLVGVGKSGGVYQAPFDSISSAMPSSLALDVRVEGRQVTVPIKSLDDICIPRFAGKRICVKIDVEGTEVDIFENGIETLKHIGPDIICEVLKRAKDVEKYDQILSSHSYNKFLITDEGLKPYDKIVPQKRFKDWFFTKDAHIDIKSGELLTKYL